MQVENDDQGLDQVTERMKLKFTKLGKLRQGI